MSKTISRNIKTTNAQIPYTLTVEYKNGIIGTYDGIYTGVTVSRIEYDIDEEVIPNCHWDEPKEL